MRRRITASSVLATLVALLLFGLPLAIAAASLTRSDERGELERIALRAASGVDAGLGRTDPIELPSTERGVDLGVYDGAGHLVRGAGPDTADAPVSDALAGAFGQGVVIGGQTVLAVPVRSGEDVVAAVRVSSPVGVITSRSWLIWSVMAGLGLVALGLAAVIARLQARRLAAPLERISAVAVALGKGDLHARATVSGIADIDSVGTALNDSAERIERLLERERSFAADASHQLRTPLTGLKWTLEAAMSDPDGDLRAAAQAAITAADAMEQAVVDLLALGHDTAPRPHTDLDGLLEELAGARRGPLAAAGRQLQLSSAGEPTFVAAAPAAIDNIMVILLDNAERHGRGTVRIAVREVAGAVAVDVSDEGRTALEPARIFGGRDRDAAGHGLGLPLARRLAESSEGRLNLTSTTGPTTFTLMLPAAGSADQKPSRIKAH